MSFPSLTIEQLETACAEWQRRLRLQDWDIDIEICRHWDLEPQAQCTISQELKHATIRIKEVNDMQCNSKAYGDMEHNLLHELLHIHLDLLVADYGGSDTIKVSPGKYTDDVTLKSIAVEQAFHGLTPWMISVGRVIPI
jgi:hypothetical protein